MPFTIFPSSEHILLSHGLDLKILSFIPTKGDQALQFPLDKIFTKALKRFFAS